MSTLSEFSFLSSNGKTNIHVRRRDPEGAPRGIVQIAHGIAEHSARYDGFMEFLSDNGFIAVANDHLGHGRSVTDESELGFFAERDGWDLVVSDMKKLHGIMSGENPGLPYILFGHSMGSFLARTFIIRFPSELTAAVICGTGHQSAGLVRSGVFMANAVTRFKGAKYKSTMLSNTAFGKYNDGYENVRTPYDWLSRDETVVNRYIEDPLSGFMPSASLFRDMMSGISFIVDKKNIAKMRKDLPVLFIAGARDPVGENGAGVRRAYDAFKEAGMEDIRIKLYPECRHEILNELNKEEVMDDILRWITKRLPE